VAADHTRKLAANLNISRERDLPIPASLPMSAKRKATLSKVSWQETREYYTWHLRPPLKDVFDSSHWWKNQSDFVDVAALYEIARRHPLVCEYMVGMPDLPELPQIHPLAFLCVHGRASWPKLGSLMQKAWRICAGNLKGVDCRRDFEKCFSIESEALNRIKLKRTFTTKEYREKTIAQISPFVEGDMGKHPPSTIEMEAEVKQQAVAAYRNGYLLIAVAPDLAVENAESLMVQEYHQHRTEKRIVKPRARCESWLPIISEFEDAEASGHKAKSQLFTRYRRILDGIDFL
jgi:hypothetical protein